MTMIKPEMKANSLSHQTAPMTELDHLVSKFKIMALESFNDIEIEPSQLHRKGNGIVSVADASGCEGKLFV